MNGIVDVDAAGRIHDLFTTSEIWSDSSPNAIALDATHCDDALIKYELWDGGITYNEEFDLGRRDQEWRFRIHRKFLSHEDFTTNIVSLVLFKLQFWSPVKAYGPLARRNRHSP